MERRGALQFDRAPVDTLQFTSLTELCCSANVGYQIRFFERAEGTSVSLQWDPPSIPQLTHLEREQLFCSIIDQDAETTLVSDHLQVWPVERWHDEVFIKALQSKGAGKTESIYFGKHKGKLWCEVPLSYLKWIMSTPADGDSKRRKFWMKQRKIASEELERRRQEGC